MRCPYCSTENRDDREKCYHCGKDLSMLRLIKNKAKNHYNTALEYAERGRTYEAMGELKNALELDSQLNEARLLLGTLFARLDRVEEAREQWLKLLATDTNAARAQEYLCNLTELKRTLPLARRVRSALMASAAVAAIGLTVGVVALWPSREERILKSAWEEFARPSPGASMARLGELPRPLHTEQRELSAQLLESSVDRVVSERLSEANRLIVNGEFLEAQEQLKVLQDWKLPVGYRKAMDQMAALMVQSAGKKLEEAAEEPFSPEGLAAVRERHAVVKSLSEDRAALEAASKVEQDYLVKGRAELETLVREIGEAMAGGADLEMAAAKLKRAELIAGLAGQDAEVAGLNDALKRKVEEAVARERREKADRLAGRLEKALGEEELEEVLDAADGFDWDALEPSRATELRAQVDRVRGRYATEAYYSLMEQGEQFDRGEVSGDDARAALKRIARIDGHLPAALAPTAQDDLLFFSASALHALGEDEEARKHMQTLAEIAPGSPYLVTWKKMSEEQGGGTRAEGESASVVGAS